MHVDGSLPEGNGDRRAIAASVVNVLKQRFPDRVETGAQLRRQHANTVTWLDNQPPDVVVFAECCDDVADVVRIAAEHQVPVIAFRRRGRLWKAR